MGKKTPCLKVTADDMMIGGGAVPTLPPVRHAGSWIVSRCCAAHMASPPFCLRQEVAPLADDAASGALAVYSPVSQGGLA